MRELTKTFGGLTSVADVSLVVPEGSITAVIGPNGAGKSTLFNLVSNLYRPDRGQVLLEGETITGLAPNAIAKRGLFRTLQTSRVFSGLTVLENVLVGACRYEKAGYAEQLLWARRARREEGEIFTRARAIMEALELDRWATQPANVLPLAAHYSRPLIGVLTALSAVTQLASRLGSAKAMRYVTDRNVIAAAGLTIAVSALVLVWSHQVVIFVIAELVQGLARGMFWTGTQAHVVRSRQKAVGRLATVNFVSSFGLLGGPPIAGVLSTRSFTTALWVAAALGLVAAVMAATLMARLDVFAAPSSGPRQNVWSNPGVRVGCWAGTTAGAWRGLVGSYIPVALRAASESSTLVGIMVGVANGSSLVGTATMGVIGSRHTRATFVAGVVATGAGVALTGFSAQQAVLVGAFIALSGVSAGMLQTLGPATAATAVEKDRRGMPWL